MWEKRNGRTFEDKAKLHRIIIDTILSKTFDWLFADRMRDRPLFAPGFSIGIPLLCSAYLGLFLVLGGLHASCSRVLFFVVWFYLYIIFKKNEWVIFCKGLSIFLILLKSL